MGRPLQAASILASSSAVSRSSSAEATTRLASASSPGGRSVTSECLASTVTAAARGGAATARSSRSASRSCSTQCCGRGKPRREPPAHRAAAAAEVVDHERPGGGEVPREAPGELGRARRRVGRLAQGEPLRADPDAHRAHRAAPASTPARSDVVAAHRRSDARRSRAARRRRPRRSASPSHARSAAPRAAGSPGGTSSPGRVPSAAVPERLGHPADLGGEDRHAAGQGLGDDHAVRLGARGEHEQVRGGVRAVEVRAGARSREAHPVVQPVVLRAAPHAGGERRVADQAADAGAAPGQVGRGREPVEQHVVPLVGRHRRDAQQRVAGRRPRRGACGVDAGPGDVHPVGRERVQLLQPAPGPCAGRDDGGGRREDLALARPDRAGLVVRRAVAERHVDEHDLPEAARVRHERLGGGACDQPVEQHHGPVRDPPDGAREGGVAAPAPSLLAHRPAERGELPADPAVVRVPAARPRRVVDPLRDDDVDLRHSGRS